MCGNGSAIPGTRSGNKSPGGRSPSPPTSETSALSALEALLPPASMPPPAAWMGTPPPPRPAPRRVRESAPPSAARGGVAAGIGTLRQYAELGPLHRGRTLAGDWTATDLMVYEPRGVAAVITPWNDPVAVSCGLLGAALVTGNTVVYKPSERTPATGWLLGRLFADALSAAGAPPGVVTTLSGGAQVGARLIEEPLDLIAHVHATGTVRRV